DHCRTSSSSTSSTSWSRQLRTAADAYSSAASQTTTSLATSSLPPWLLISTTTTHWLRKNSSALPCQSSSTPPSMKPLRWPTPSMLDWVLQSGLLTATAHSKSLPSLRPAPPGLTPTATWTRVSHSVAPRTPATASSSV